ncbi:MAG TPA: RIO1 family regulatory kinase/ATPase [Kofleriaceae bacterium]|nr:RIO1 family regulatory kinase/ATPase [Kofleriaceae bacterium]
MADPLDVLLADGVIDEILGRLKSGKEANISLIRRGDDVLAAKVYKDRSTRSFKNNADYKEGRKVRNSRTQRAMDSGGKFGRDAAEQAWKSAEADALYKLIDAGVRVPAPVMFYEGVLLMELVKDAEGRPAPRLIDVALEPTAALGVYADLLAQMIAMLCCDLIHGDLSPYNILAAADGPTIIDFPQVVSAVHSSRAEFFFLRDFDNVVRFVSGFDPALAIHRHDGRAIWRAYVARDLTRSFVPPPPPPPQPARGGPRWRDQRSDDRRPEPRGQGGPPRNQGGPPPRDPRPSNGGPPPRDPQWNSRPPPRDPRSNGAPPEGRRDGGDPRRGNGAPTGGPRGPATAGAPDRSRDRGPARGPDRGPAPPPQQARPPRREWSMPAPAPSSPAPSRGKRRRPKRHW